MVPDAFKCPKCGGEPLGTVERIEGVALVSFDDEGKPFYAGDTDIDWDMQETIKVKGEVLFACDDCSNSYTVSGITDIG